MSTSTPGGGPAPEASHQAGKPARDQAGRAGGTSPLTEAGPAVDPAAEDFPAPDPEIAPLIAADPEAAAAVQLVREFDPRGDTDYGWVAEYGEKQYAQYAADFKDLDDKAASIVGYLGSGTGLLTLGSLAAATVGQVNGWVIVLALPSVALAAWAVWVAIEARWTEVLPAPPLVADALEYAGCMVVVPVPLTNQQLARLTPRERKWFNDGMYPPNVRCYLSPEGEKAAAQLKAGVSVQIRGRVVGSKTADVWQNYLVELEGCTVEPAPSPGTTRRR